MAPLSMADFMRILEESGWTEDSPGQLAKGTWRIVFDTSSWMVLANPRTIDVAIPDEYHSRWTVNLIEHLLRSEDEFDRLRAALSAIRDDPSVGPSAQSVAAAALADLPWRTAPHA